MATTGQTINDRFNAVRYALVGQGLARVVCKATTEEVLGPKKKHIDYLLACTNEPNVSVPQLANLLIERTQNASWTVVFKGLITIHQLMSNGNERFTQYLATSNHSFELNDFLDRTTPQGYNMSNFVRRYAKYINDKTISYRLLALDLCKIRSGNDNALRTMNMENLSKTLPIVQKQFDSLLEFGAETKDLNNGVIMSAFRLLYKDLVRMYVAYQEAIINLLERYFKLSRKKTREALELYKTYLARMDKVAEFLRTVEAVGLDKSEMPDLTKSPASILRALEDHLAGLEAKKRGTTPVSPEAGDDGGKENVAPSNLSPDGQTARSEVAIESATKSNTKIAGEVREEEQQKAVAGGGVSSASGENAAPKKPPARPSPKVSPSGSKAPTGATTSAAPTPAAPSTSSTDKKPAAPERPAKPPSRPPPPAGAGANASSSQGTSKKSPIHVSSTPPPPHPPPPQAHSPKPPASAPKVNERPGAEEAESPNKQVSAQQRQDLEEKQETETQERPAEESQSNGPEAGDTGVSDPGTNSCSANAVETHAISQGEIPTVEDTHEDGEINHVANNINGGGGQENGGSVATLDTNDPPPPPPLDDDEQTSEPVQEVAAPSPPPPLADEGAEGLDQNNNNGQQPQVNGEEHQNNGDATSAE